MSFRCASTNEKYTGISLVWFYGISTIVGYLMPNLVHIIDYI